jgi:hypothetical protein
MTLTSSTIRAVLRCVALTLTLLTIAARAQITPFQDAYINTATPATNYGSKIALDVESASQTTFIQFDLSAIPSTYTGSNIAKARLGVHHHYYSQSPHTVPSPEPKKPEQTQSASNSPFTVQTGSTFQPEKQPDELEKTQRHKTKSPPASRVVLPRNEAQQLPVAPLASGIPCSAISFVSSSFQPWPVPR